MRTASYLRAPKPNLEVEIPLDLNPVGLRSDERVRSQFAPSLRCSCDCSSPHGFVPFSSSVPALSCVDSHLGHLHFRGVGGAHISHELAWIKGP